MNLWEIYGISTTSTSGKTIFTEFETDDIDILEAELLKLDKEFGHKQIKVIKEIDANYSVDVTDTDIADDKNVDEVTNNEDVL